VMDLARRTFLSGLVASAVVPAKNAFAESGKAVCVSACRHADNKYSTGFLDHQGRIIWSSLLPGRAHSMAVSPDGKSCVTFARRPGRFVMESNLATRTTREILQAAPGRHFYGHGVFSTDGRRLYASENAWESGEGRIGVYDVTQGYKRLGEFPSGGIGPHEIILAGDGHTLVVANGGIRTHPDSGRRKLNRLTMEPSLAWLNPGTGRLVRQARLPDQLHQLSIRHLCLDGQNRVWFACQNESQSTDVVPLLGVESGNGLALLDLPRTAIGGLQQYVGSICASADGTRIAATSPRGHMGLVLSASERKLVQSFEMKRVCGVTAANNTNFIWTSGTGHTRTPEGDQFSAGHSWDNHLVQLPS
jgi:uncharacterized protein